MSKNVVLVVMDTARAFDTRFVREHVSDSTLDTLAKTGTDFTHAFTNAPWTLPSHASMFTGTFTSKHGTHAGHKSYDGQFRTIAEVLSEAGYETVGVTNNAWVTDEFGLDRGFDTFYKVWQYIQTDTDFGEIKLTTHGFERIKRGAAALFSGSVFANLVNSIYGQFFYRREDYGANRTNAIVRRWISERNADTPFFLFLNYLEPHLDYQPPREHVREFLPAGASYDEAMDVPQEPWEYVSGALDLAESDLDLLRALYRAEIYYLDQQLGTLRSILEEAGVWEDTVFIVVGDHGENIGDHGLMDHQYSVHDSLIHVPLLVHGGDFTGGGENDDLVQTIDLFPTILDSVGLSAPAHVQGISFHPDSSESSREAVYAEYLSPQPEIERLSQQTGVSRDELDRFDRKLRTIRTDEHKLIRGSDGSTQLFDVSDDVSERRDLSDSKPDVAQTLEAQLDAWLESFEHAATDSSSSMSERTKRQLEDLGYLQ